ncbi:MAG TPA: sulfur carrier protein ThiS [Candidatus Baltobacteraceae bacterium]|nr:sulfur carrier protein ThiS [Candidatus Baltobacteraceae bacterium]
MKATINGESLELPEGLTVAGLLEFLGTIRQGIAVARNDSVVPRARYDSDYIQNGDRIEIIRAVAGG